MPTNIVQQTTANGAGSASPSLSGVTPGNSLVLIYGQPSAGTRTYSASGYTNVVDYMPVSPDRAQGVLVKHGSAGGTENPTINANTGTLQVYVWLLEVSGLDSGASPVTPTGSGQTNTSTTTGHHCAPTGEIDTSVAGLSVAVGTLGGTSGGFTAATSWTALDAAAVTTVNAQYRITTGAVADDRATYTTVTSRGSVNTMCSFPESTGGGGGGGGETRSGEFRSGENASGDISTWGLTVHVGGTDRSTYILKRDLNIIDNLGRSPSEAWATFRDSSGAVIPTVGQTFEVYNGGYGVGVPYFRGRVTKLSPSAAKQVGGAVRYAFDCTDWTWDLNRYRVTARYDNLGVNSILARLLYTYAEGGFVVGYAPSSLGTLNQIEFTDVGVAEAIDQLAGRVSGGAYWSCDYNRNVSIIPAAEQDPALGGSTIALADGDELMLPSYTEDLTETFTRVTAIGGGSESVGVTSSSSTTVAVAEIGWYASTGGSFMANNQVATYTGTSASSGAGNLTGVSGLLRDIPEGTAIRPLYVANDAGAATALATLVGGAGIRELTYSNQSLDDAGTRLVAAAALAIRKDKFTNFQWTENDDPTRNIMAGKTVGVSITGNIPVTISTGRVQAVAMMVVGRSQANSQPKIYRKVSVAPLAQGLVDFLDRIASGNIQVI